MTLLPQSITSLQNTPNRSKLVKLSEILNDLKTDRVKKCILDSDMYNEMDDQYALAYCLGTDKIQLLSVNAAPFDNGRSLNFEMGMIDSYNEILRVYDVCTTDSDTIPAYKGSSRRFSPNDGYAPIDSPAARNIIKTAMELDEILYILTTGCCSNVISACLIEPKIKDKICVIWLGGHQLENGGCREFNLEQDYAAGQLLLNNDIPLILLPAIGPDPFGGTQVLRINMNTLRSITGDGRAQRFFREELPREYFPTDDPVTKIAAWDSDGTRILWDIAAPGVICCPDAYEFKIIPAPVFTDNDVYAFDKTRHPIIYMSRLNGEQIIYDAVKAISSIHN